MRTPPVVGSPALLPPASAGQPCPGAGAIVSLTLWAVACAASAAPKQVRACELLTPAELTADNGLSTPFRISHDGGDTCHWETNDLGATLTLETGENARWVFDRLCQGQFVVKVQAHGEEACAHTAGKSSWSDIVVFSSKRPVTFNFGMTTAKAERARTPANFEKLARRIESRL